MNPKRFHFDVYQVPVSSQATPPALTQEHAREVLAQLFDSGSGLSADVIGERAVNTLSTMFKDVFKLDKAVTWISFQPYRLPIDGLFEPVVLILYGNSEWSKQIGGNMIVVRRQGGRLPTGMFGESKATYKAVERFGWAVDLLSKQEPQ